MQQPTLLVLAAGMGARYGGLKQIEPMGPNGETMLDYSVYDALQAGFDKVVFVIRKQFENEFKKVVGSKFEDRIEVAYAFQDLLDLPEGFSIPEGRTKPWGTAHAIRAARDVVTAPFAAINADDFYGRDSYQQIVDYFSAQNLSSDREKEHYCMVGFQIENTLSEHGFVSRGVCSVKDGSLTSVEEHSEIQRTTNGMIQGKNMAGELVTIADGSPVSMNFWGFSPTAFKHIESFFVDFLNERGSDPTSECYIPSVVDFLIHSGKADCRVLSTNSPWFGVTYPADKPIVAANLKRLTESGLYDSI